jgi:PPOX class probable F420-dependent enzyme
MVLTGAVPLGAEERAFAQHHRVAHLATAGAAGTPHVIPVCYVLVRENFYFVVDDKPKRTRRQLKRLRNIAENAQVALVMDDYDEDWTRLAYLLVQGDAALVSDREEYAAVLDLLRQRYAQYRQMNLLFERHPMVRIQPQSCHLWRAAGRSAGDS